ncbi:uncharacterized protein A4U43_C09F1450 [Asparagus officinalis]|uniref:Uncharacterized protein n=1 Tax=Asparagus officinalis TaxID=4686 RepID=A0A5P1E4G7_ASPOF|nr:uncharacterized protein A4U43_C09F1450 [Asparagus officinalis]
MPQAGPAHVQHGRPVYTSRSRLGASGEHPGHRVIPPSRCHGERVAYVLTWQRAEGESDRGPAGRARAEVPSRSQNAFNHGRSSATSNRAGSRAAGRYRHYRRASTAITPGIRRARLATIRLAITATWLGDPCKCGTGYAGNAPREPTEICAGCARAGRADAQGPGIHAGGRRPDPTWLGLEVEAKSAGWWDRVEGLCRRRLVGGTRREEHRGEGMRQREAGQCKGWCGGDKGAGELVGGVCAQASRGRRTSVEGHEESVGGTWGPWMYTEVGSGGRGRGNWTVDGHEAWACGNEVRGVEGLHRGGTRGVAPIRASARMDARSLGDAGAQAHRRLA